MFTKKLILTLPLFILFFGVNDYNFQQSILLFQNPFQLLDNSQWLQESPITFLIGFGINSVINDTSTTYWIVVFFGFLYLYTILYFYEKNEVNGEYFAKFLFFSPFFLIIFSWMGKPDTYMVGSLLALLTFRNNNYISLLSIIILVFSHPQIAFIYLVLIIFLKIYKLNFFQATSFIISYFLYFYYLSFFDSEVNGRIFFIIDNFEFINKAFFTNTLVGLLSLFSWLWIIIMNSKILNDIKFSISLFVLLFISYFSLDFTRTFITMAIPLIIYMSMQESLTIGFKNSLSHNFIYILGFIQVQKLPGGFISDSSWATSSLSQDQYFYLVDKFGKIFKDFILIFYNLFY